MSRGSDDLLTRIDAELRDALSVSPSSDFLPRVRERIRDRAAAPRLTWLRVLAPATIAASTLILCLWLATPPSEVPPRLPAPAAVATSPPAAAPEAPSLVREARRTVPGQVSSKASGTAPRVLIPVEERVAFERGVTSLRTIGLTEWVPVAETERVAAISIAPIAISPVTFP